MISRRLIRIKVFKLIFSNIYTQSTSITGAGNELIKSLEKTVDLYYLLLSLPVALKKYRISKIELGLKKFHPTPQEANPNRKFVTNRAILTIENDNVRQNYVAKHGLHWKEFHLFIKKLLTDLENRPYFVDYMNDESSSFKDDVALLTKFFTLELEDNDDLFTILEDQNLYWIDDLSYTLGVVLRTLSSLQEGAPLDHPDMFKQQEDKVYALRLLEHALLHYDQYLDYIRTFAHNWDVDRMATTDICLIILGVSEVICCPTIPVKVTINEVVELSKYYSTPNSRLFVNGVLDKIITHLKENGQFTKEGRGLVDN
ncbi:MAG: transcription antitermination protein NusB [Prevotellaceae bacterium]|jgi:N utilization substance protein B|nr:transcription antitermination protein NusB [Prevotellaceae bacterium]